jgi:hypothetical protein
MNVTAVTVRCKSTTARYSADIPIYTNPFKELPTHVHTDFVQTKSFGYI